MSRVRIGIVGAGFVARLHATAYRRITGCDVVAVYSRNPANARALADEFDIPGVAPSLAELLARADVDVVDVCTPNPSHGEITLAAVAAGKNVICEKPLTAFFGSTAEPPAAVPAAQQRATALAAADRILAAADAAGVQLMYAENWVYAPPIRRMLGLIEASRSPVLELRGEESHHGSHSSNSRSWSSSGGGALLMLGAHPLGAMIHVKHREGVLRHGRPIVPHTVLASVGNLTRSAAFSSRRTDHVRADAADVEDWATTIVDFDDGTKGVVSASYVCLGGMKATFDAFTADGRFHCDLTRSDLLTAYAPDDVVLGDQYLNEKLETTAGWSAPGVDEVWMLGYQAELEDFVEAVQQQRPPLATGALARTVIDVVYGAYESAAGGRSVALRC